MDRSKQTKAHARVIARAWSDSSYRDRLKKDPDAVLAEAGLDLPKGKHVHVVEDTDTRAHFVLPVRPSHITDADLRSEEPHPDICTLPF